MGDLLPELASHAEVGLERDGPFQQRNRFTHLVASCGKAGCAAQPDDGARTHSGEFFLLALPGEILVFRAYRLAVMVGELGGILVPGAAGFLEPGGVPGVHVDAPRRRQAAVRDVARQRVYEGGAALADPDEAAAGEHVEARLLADKRAD